jgi:hypothetical protein
VFYEILWFGLLPSEVFDTTTANSYIIKGLKAGITYEFAVRTINSVGTSGNSNMIEFPFTVPDPPTNLREINSKSTIVEFSWTAPAYNGASAVTSYNI